MNLKSFKAGTPMEEFEKALAELTPRTQKGYRRYFAEFCKAMETTPEDLYRFALDAYRSENVADRKALRNAFVAFYNGLVKKGVHINTARNYKKAVNKFLEANGLPTIKGGVKGVDYKGQTALRDEEIEEILSYAKTPRAIALVNVLKDTGLRVSDAALLTVEDFKKAERKTHEGQEFRRWRNPITSTKTGVNAYVCMGPDAIRSVENYIGNREHGPIFLTERSMFHWILNDEGERVRTVERTEMGDPMEAKNMTNVMCALCKPLRNRGIKASAHSIRKFFFTGWEADRMLNTGKYIAGKRISAADAPYIQPDYFKAYMEHYFNYLALDKAQSEELKKLREKVKTLTTQLSDMDDRIDGLRHEVRMEREKIGDARGRANYYEWLWEMKQMDPEERARYLKSLAPKGEDGL